MNYNVSFPIMLTEARNGFAQRSANILPMMLYSWGHLQMTAGPVSLLRLVLTPTAVQMSVCRHWHLVSHQCI